MRIIVEITVIMICLLILVSEYRPIKSDKTHGSIITNTFKYYDYKMLNDETKEKSPKDIRYIETH